MKSTLIAITGALVLSACGGGSSAPRSLPSADQKETLKAIQKSLVTAQLAAIQDDGFEHRDTKQDDGDILGDEEARIQMRNQLQDAIDDGDCKVTQTGSFITIGSGTQTPGPKSATLDVTGTACPISLHMVVKFETDGARKGSQNGIVTYSVTQTPAGEKYRKLNDVDSATFSVQVDAYSPDGHKSFTISGYGSGKIHSQKHGTLAESGKIYVSKQADGTGSARAEDSYTLPGFSIERELTATVKDKKSDVTYTVNGNVVPEKEFVSYGDFLLPISDPSK